MAGNVHRLGEPFRRAVEQPALQILLGSEGDGMDQDVEPAPLFRNGLEQRFELAGLADIERHEDRRFQRFRHGLDVGF